MELPSTLLSSSSEKKFTSKNGKWKFLALELTKFSCFLKRKLFLYFLETETSFPFKTLLKTLLKTVLYLGRSKFLSTSLKSFHISGGTCKSRESNISQFLFVEWELFKHKCKRKKFLILSLIKKQNFRNQNNFL